MNSISLKSNRQSISSTNSDKVWGLDFLLVTKRAKGMSPNELISYGYSWKDIKHVGYTVPELKYAGVAACDVKSTGVK